MIYQRKTIESAVSFSGKGLHTGVPVTMTVKPGNQGIQFVHGEVTTVAHPSNVTDTTRSTKLGNVGTVEHIMSALCGLEITDAVIELDAPEVPGVDGSALPFVLGLSQAGSVELGEARVPELYRRVFLQEGDIKIAIGKGNGHWRYEYILKDRWPGHTIFESADVVAQYESEIAPARTFALEEEVPFILQMGLAQGLDESSAVILGKEGYKNEARFADEPVRHKLLDILGDLYLAGIPARFLSVVGERSGHKANVKAAQMLCEAIGRTL